MLTRRHLGMLAVSAAVLAQCTNGTIDPNAVLAALKTGCGIAVPVATIVAIINAAVGATVQSIVDLLCSGFQQAQAAQALQGRAKASAGQTVEYDVVVNGKTIHVVATVQ